MESIGTHCIRNENPWDVELMLDPDFGIRDKIVLYPGDEFVLNYDLGPYTLFIREFVLGGRHRLLISYVEPECIR
jgi:hypothetical protein